jgi:hypothetical protein
MDGDNVVLPVGDPSRAPVFIYEELTPGPLVGTLVVNLAFSVSDQKMGYQQQRHDSHNL